MKLVVLADELKREELLRHGWQEPVQVIQVTDPGAFAEQEDADGYLDLMFEPGEERLSVLKKLGGAPVIIASLLKIDGLPSHFVRINGWPGFLGRNLAEATCADEVTRKATENIFAGFNKNLAWTPDVSGLVTARVIAMIINEAYYALEEGVSSREEIDVAMKLGTNYPYGPFEWSRMLGLKNILQLLEALELENERYAPAPLLKKEAGN